MTSAKEKGCRMVREFCDGTHGGRVWKVKLTRSMLCWKLCLSPSGGERFKFSPGGVPTLFFVLTVRTFIRVGSLR